MRAGSLRYKIQIWNVEVTRNEFNEQQDTYTKTFETRANITSTTGQRQDVNNEVFYPKTVTFEVRYYVPIKEFDHIHFKDNRYRVLAIQEDETNLQHSQMKRIICELINE